MKYASNKGKKCRVHGCMCPSMALRLCKKHYARAKRHGSPTLTLYAVEEDAKLYLDNRPEFISYDSMKQRCLNPKAKAYKNYGGRGIKICDRWLAKPNGFKNFLKDMGKCPKGTTKSGYRAYTLDRIDVDGDYCPRNCRWADWKTQSANKRAD